MRETFSGTPWLEKINAHNGLVVIGDTVTLSEKCTGDIVIPKGVTKIGSEAFEGAESLTGVKLPEGVTSIEFEAFANTGLTSVKLPEGLKKIGARAFEGTGLTDVNIPESVDYIASSAFSDTPYMEGLYNDKGLAIDGKWLLDVRKAYGNVAVPAGVTHIANSAFSGANMQSIALPDGLVSIGDSAFCYAKFKQIAIPDSVVYVGAFAFSGSSLFKLDENKYKDGSVVVFGKTAMIGGDFKQQEETVIVPDGVESIRVSDIIGSSYLRLKLPDSVSYFADSLMDVFKEITYKGKTYKTRGSNGASEREALKAAIEGN